MNGDAVERGVGGALAGAVAQLALGGALLGLAFYTGHPAEYAGAWMTLAAFAPWLYLVVLMHQKRLARLEALDAETLAKNSAEGATLFERGGDDLLAARRRVGQLERVAQPMATVLTGLAWLVLGIYLAQRARGYFGEKAEELPLSDNLAVTMGLHAFCAFLGFAVARYLAGLSKLPGFGVLRGGSGLLMAAVTVHVLLALGHGIASFELPVPLHALALVLPLVMAVLGLEMLATQVLEFYRPRRPGQEPRASFDSRILGLLTSPDGLAGAFREAVNYQFGFEVTRSWFWKLLGRAALPLFGFAVAVLLGLSCVVIVEPHQQALVYRFGQLSPKPLGPGLSFKLPWPFETSETVDVTRVREVFIGTGADLDPTKPILWNNRHTKSEETYMFTAARGSIGPDTKVRGISLIQVEVPVQFSIRDLAAYRQASDDPDRVLKLLGERELSRFVLSEEEDQLLGAGRTTAGALLKKRIQAAADKAKLGVDVVFVGVSSFHPPMETAEAYLQSVNALAEKESTIQTALKDEIEKLSKAAGSPQAAQGILDRLTKLSALPQEKRADLETDLEHSIEQSGGEAAAKIARARATRWEREYQEAGKAERFTQEVHAYDLAPRLYKERRYLEAFFEGLKEARKYVILATRDKMTVRLDLKEEGLGLGTPLVPPK